YPYRPGGGRSGESILLRRPANSIFLALTSLADPSLCQSSVRGPSVCPLPCPDLICQPLRASIFPCCVVPFAVLDIVSMRHPPDNKGNALYKQGQWQCRAPVLSA